MLTLNSISTGKTIINERVFENRFLIVPELIKMGAKIKILSSHKVQIEGVEALKGAEIEAKELRGGASLVLAGLIASGKTIVKNINFIDRGYDKLEKVLSMLGARIRRI